ncbi:RDD family protein [Metabacillus malikii]|uniref:RDD family membrane protein YckC n=1 Tax=Metabacillus malikii TaxID=1504265 RepID=A0ABT9ZFX3_9BACI|nr:RDD family protein [Metabacillus malikii]MDQ0231149.1 putative RDD family membrane protein YckC [Metabacillus malikii]
MEREKIDIKTPEFVSLQFQSAGLGSRAAAFIIDQILLSIANILIVIGFLLLIYGFSSLSFYSYELMFSIPFAIMLIVLFILNWAYYVVLEYFSGGKTVGKRIVGIRVIQDNGHSITLLSSFIRNLLRIIDSLPAYYLLGMFMVFFHSKNKRLGDLVAGTIVVHERRKKKNKLSAIEKEIKARGLSKESLLLDEWVLRSLGEKEWKLVHTYCHRVLNLPSAERKLLTIQLAQRLFPKIEQLEKDKTTEELENIIFVLYLYLKEEWEFDFS